MRVLLDAHTLIWAGDDPAKVPAPAMSVMQNPANELLIGAGTIWEIAIKVAIGKLSLSLPYRQWLDKAIIDQVFESETMGASSASSTGDDACVAQLGFHRVPGTQVALVMRSS